MSITLYLMTQKGFNVLKAIINSNYHQLIFAVVVGRDKNINNDFAEEIKQLCGLNNIKCFEKNEDFKIESDYSIAISWRWLIADSTSKLIVLHDSLLPRYRGFAPLVNMLINKEAKIGVSAILASEEYDRGDIIAQSSTNINYPIKISNAIDLISKNYAEIIIKIFDELSKQGSVNASKQNEAQATYSLWRVEEDYLIDWQQDANDILNFINAVSSPYKGASTFINGSRKVRILEAVVEADVKIENRDVGKVIFIREKQPVIVCGTGLIRLMEVVDDETKENLLPFKNFRIRLTSNYAIFNR